MKTGSELQKPIVFRGQLLGETNDIESQIMKSERTGPRGLRSDAIETVCTYTRESL